LKNSLVRLSTGFLILKENKLSGQVVLLQQFKMKESQYFKMNNFLFGCSI